MKNSEPHSIKLFRYGKMKNEKGFMVSYVNVLLQRKFFFEKILLITYLMSKNNSKKSIFKPKVVIFDAFYIALKPKNAF